MRSISSIPTTDSYQPTARATSKTIADTPPRFQDVVRFSTRMRDNVERHPHRTRLGARDE